MNIVFHRLVSRDVREAMMYHRDVSGERLVGDFYEEFMAVLRAAADQPERFHLDASGLRRASLKRFPFHFLYRIGRDSIRVLVLRHHRRSPEFGLGRSWL